MDLSRFGLRRRWVTGVVASAIMLPEAARLQPSDSFRIFDSLSHRGKPNLESEGLELILPISNIWRAGVSHDDVDETGIRSALAQIASSAATVFIDIENWPLFPVNSEVIGSSVAKMIKVCGVIRNRRPDLKIGFYGAPPVNAYWPIISQDRSYQLWLEANRAMAPVAEQVDYLFPSLYTFYDDPNRWLQFAAAQLDAARSYNKPVYPFLWYEYHDSNLLLRGHDVRQGAWEQELQFCRSHADGVVLWGGWQRTWSESAPWWQASRRLLLTRPQSPSALHVDPK